jgi:hypothetical protein
MKGLISADLWRRRRNRGKDDSLMIPQSSSIIIIYTLITAPIPERIIQLLCLPAATVPPPAEHPHRDIVLASYSDIASSSFPFLASSTEPTHLPTAATKEEERSNTRTGKTDEGQRAKDPRRVGSERTHPVERSFVKDSRRCGERSSRRWCLC